MLHHHRFRVKALLLLPLPPTQRNRRGRQVLNRTFSSLIFFLCFSGTWTPKSTPKGGKGWGLSCSELLPLPQSEISESLSLEGPHHLSSSRPWSRVRKGNGDREQLCLGMNFREQTRPDGLGMLGRKAGVLLSSPQ